ncbi:carboxylate--amine ligase [Desulfonema ishimotonii]|uniref:Carboxylate--amine ligase n=1 Tax=Desulfonema ishimotonii TaxID=45657 RepID=A0A401FW95_9BACT|nr:ATP-grasp domain-containing protein [Desulfonema ishimotonii]GBC61262.1 carboxylate--amine ligase [Desulfonema ishimotonii]
MNIIYLSPQIPPNYYLFSVRLREMGANVLGIADAPYDRLAPDLREALTEYYRVDDMNDYDQLLRACGYFTHAFGRIDRIESHSEYWLEAEARLRTDFNVAGIKLHQLARITQKSEMKKLFRNAGVQVARGRLFKNEESAGSLVLETGYPLVFKPNRGFGAAGALRIDDDAGLEALLADVPPIRYFMEEFIRGQLCSFDGLTDRDGNVVFYTAHVFSQGIMETVNEDLDLFYYSLRKIPADLEEAGFNTVRAFDIREKFFHIEFFRTPDDRLVGLEVNARPPGGLTTDMFNYANNIDVYRGWAGILVNNRFGETYTRPYHCGYIGRKLNKSYLHSHRDIMRKYGYLIVQHGPVESPFSAAIGNYAYIANAQRVEEMEAVARFIQETDTARESA